MRKMKRYNITLGINLKNPTRLIQLNFHLICSQYYLNNKNKFELEFD